MTWVDIARQDGGQTIRTRSTKLLLGLLVTVVVLAGYVYPLIGSEPITTAGFAGFVTGWLTTLVPLVGVLLGYNAVVGDRASGALLLSLSLPDSRRDVAMGRYVGRTGVLAGTTVIALVGAGALVVYPFGELDALRYLGFLVLAIGYTAIWTGLGVAVSLLVASKRLALVLAFGLFFLAVVVWDTVAAALELALTELGLVDAGLPDPIAFVFGLEPGRLFVRLTDGFIDPRASVDGAWYLSEWIALLLFGCWIVVPLGVALYRFDRSDLA